MVVSGAPDRTKYHALHICDMALDMVQAMTGLRDPSSKGNMKIRVGELFIIVYIHLHRVRLTNIVQGCTNGRPISFKVLPMVDQYRSRFYQ